MCGSCNHSVDTIFLDGEQKKVVQRTVIAGIVLEGTFLLRTRRAIFNAPVIKLFEVCFLLTQTKYVGALFPAPETGESPETDLSFRTLGKVAVINRKLQDFCFY